jgi:LCP family protein required for cell wall assembly
MPKNNMRRQRLFIGILLGVFAAVMLIVLAGAGYAYWTFQKISVTANRPSNGSPEATPELDPWAEPKSFLLLGYGGGAHSGGKLTDTMMVARVDPARESVYLISLPRDLWVPLQIIDGQETWSKINAAYAIGSDDKRYTKKPIQYTGEAGGGEMAKDAVQTVLGFPIDHFASVSFEGFRKSIDDLNGVIVNVERPFTDPLYPITGSEDDPCGKTEEEIATITATMSATELEKQFPCRYEVLQFNRGKTLMDGTTALKYVRSRHSAEDGSDFGRAARQRNLIISVRDRVFALDFFPKAIPFINTLSDDVRTDLTINDMQGLLEKRNEWRGFSIHAIALTDDNVLKLGVSADRQSIVIPREGIGQWQGVQAWVQAEMDRLYQESQASKSGVLATPSASVKPVGN